MNRAKVGLMIVIAVAGAVAGCGKSTRSDDKPDVTKWTPGPITEPQERRDAPEQDIADLPEAEGGPEAPQGDTAWPFTSTEAKRRQQATADRLGVPTELTLDCNGGEMRLVLIPAGQFEMGSPALEAGRDDDEGPVRRVRITQPFYMSAREVTQAQYEAVTGDNPSYFKGETHPVEMVSWADATSFCRTLSGGGRTVRLPTEAEWEYACRAGTETALNSGLGLTSTTGACRNVAAVGWYSDNSDSTRAAGEKAPNAWGLYDMHGNVWEWCADRYGEYVKEDVNDPQGPSSGSDHVLRGGSWTCHPRYCRSADRRRSGAAPLYSSHGFRVVLDMKHP